MTIRVAVYGAAGRMGRAVIAGVVRHRDLRLVEAVELPGSPYVGSDAGLLAGVGELGVRLTDDLARALEADVVIDFTTASATEALLQKNLERRVPVVVGTTGLAGEALAAVEALAKVAPVVQAPNFSVGVAVMLHLAHRAAALLGEGYDAEIVEMHHRNKTDAPSGTALRLAETVREAKGFPESCFVTGREGNVGARPTGEIGVMTLRGGDVIGDHTLILAGGGERLEITHRAQDRALFARGAVRAAAWLPGQAPGRYTMTDVLALESTG